ncbi:hypothetical protein MN0502_35120 (plasmid) [Arthrobacter sp. MN05-02]|nr:hypothetical protein MN0502_35120 [Arthrobacter sp. MN05-02]
MLKTAAPTDDVQIASRHRPASITNGEVEKDTTSAPIAPTIVRPKAHAPNFSDLEIRFAVMSAAMTPNNAGIATIQATCTASSSVP